MVNGKANIHEHKIFPYVLVFWVTTPWSLVPQYSTLLIHVCPDAISLKHCKIWSFHGGDYDERCLLGCYAVWLL
jgi:hypothetical protein